MASLLVLVGAAACGDDSGAVDAGVPADARRFADAGRLACSPDAGCPAGRTSVCDAERGSCVECAGDADCAAAATLGPSCDTGPGHCTCSVDQDCVGRLSGPTCHRVAQACTCVIDADCSGGGTCEFEAYLGVGVRVCTVAATRSR